MTTRSYETEVYASPGDGGTVRGIAYATTIDQFATYDENNQPVDGSDGFALAGTADVSGLKVGPADVLRDGKSVGSVEVRRLNRSLNYFSAIPVEAFQAKVGDEIVQYEVVS